MKTSIKVILFTLLAPTLLLAQDEISLSTGIIGNGRLLGAQTYDAQRTIGVLGIDSAGDTKLSGQGGLSVTPQGDANRKHIFSASSDTAMTYQFGDAGSTATQSLVVSASTADADDDSTMIIAGGGARGTSGSRGAFVALEGNEVAGGGDLRLSSGVASGSVVEFAHGDTVKAELNATELYPATAGGITLGTAALPFSQLFCGNGTINGTLSYSAGESAAIVGSTTNHALKFRANNVSLLTLGTDGSLIGAGTGSFGWAVVDGTDNTACTSQCTAPAVFGFDLAGGATAPVLVGPSAATADICLCAGAS